jgi:CTP:molybdopterin cytidylyltransferase MocA
MKSPSRAATRSAEEEKIVPIILAAGPRGSLPFPKALAPFGRATALERAVRCCSEGNAFGFAVVVLGSEAGTILAKWKPQKGIIVVRNPEWEHGQISSLRAGLRCVPRNAAFLLYPVDYPLLFPGLLARLWWAYIHRSPGEAIVVPAMHGRDGHPILVAPELRREFLRAETARDVVHRKDRPQRILRVRVRDQAIFRDFDSPSTYRLCVSLLAGHYRA